MEPVPKLQRKSFTPASFHVINESDNELMAIKVYSISGHSSGIIGIGYVYNDQSETTWGDVDEAVPTVFFFRTSERIAKVTFYGTGLVDDHLQVVESVSLQP
jgi:hypothetical protein